MKTYLRSTSVILPAMVSASCVLANPLPQTNIPIPILREQITSAPQMGTDQITTGALHAKASIPAISGNLQQGLDALDDKDPLRALSIRNGMAKNDQERAILTWAIVQSGSQDVPSFEILEAMTALSGWPGVSNLRYRWERALYNEAHNPNAIIAAFGPAIPKTAEGAITLSAAWLKKGQTSKAKATILPFWHHERLDQKEENEILETLGKVLTKQDHKKRMDMLLYHDRVTQAARFSKLAGAESLYRARAATIRKEKNADSLIQAVHKSWHKDPSYLFTRIERARREQRWSEAEKLLQKTPKDPSQLVNAAEWWVEQRIVSRIFYEKGDAKTAYRIASQHSATRARDVVEAEFHAGFFALRGLQNANLAAAHFANILEHATTPTSTSRAYYWLGRAAEMGGPGSAKNYYELAARYPTAYYGQLAGARIQKTGLNVSYPKPTLTDRQNFANRTAVQAIKKLEQAGHAWRSDRIYRALAYELTSPGELALLAAMAEKRQNYQLSLQVGKIAYRRGLDVAALAFPLGAIPKSANISGTGKALAYSIARQESTFNKAAISPADARGLLQLLPSTAKRVAKDHGIAYSKARLTTDASMNATLGAHFLSEQIANFNGSYIMTFIGYNAGPRRVPQWIDRFGNPYGKDIDQIVDWVEMIPFTETRNYVQRVMENYQVYKMRLGQKTDIVQDLRYGRP